MLSLITFFVAAVVFSFICSVSEAGLLSLQRTDVLKLKELGTWGAGILEQLKGNVERSLAAILTVNTLANCFGAAGVGSAAAKLWGTSGMAAASAVMTITILVFSEIIPKTLGATYSFRLASVIAVAVQAMLIATYPIVLIMGQVSKLIAGKPQPFSREDVERAAKLGVADGVLVEREAEVISKFLDRIGTPVQSRFTPAREVSSFSQAQTVDEVCGDDRLFAHSHFPVYTERPDEIAGIVRKDAILKKSQEGLRDCRLQEITCPAVTVRENETLEQAAARMQQQMAKLILVVDDNNRYLGVLSTGDLLKHLFGKGLSEIA